MTRRKLLKIGAGAAAVAVGGAGLADAVAKAATPVGLEGIWPYCVRWNLYRYRYRPGWWLHALFVGVPLRTLKQFDGECDCDQRLTLPLPGEHGGAIFVTGVVRGWSLISEGLEVSFEGPAWTALPIDPERAIRVDLRACSVSVE